MIARGVSLLLVGMSVACSSGKEPSTAETAKTSELTDAGARETDAAAAGDVRTLFVNAQQVDCTGAGPQKCLQTRVKETDPWELFYGGIEGFTFEPGHVYELRVEVSKVDNPPADGSSLRYRLIEIVAKKP